VLSAPAWSWRHSSPGACARDLGATNLELAYRLIPASGNNWGEISHSQAAEAEFLARVSPLLHPRFETVWRQSEAGSESTAGLWPTLEALRRIGRAFETLVALPELYIDLGDRVLVLLTREGRTVDGVDFAEQGAALYIIEEGRLRRMELYADRALALSDAGITEAEARERGVPLAEMGYAAFERE
jgi:ketosteroid isomerase-like protein